MTFKANATGKAARVIRTVKFASFGRTGSSATAVREVHARTGKLSPQGTFETVEESDDGGVLIDDKIRVPAANVLWIEYE